MLLHQEKKDLETRGIQNEIGVRYHQAISPKPAVMRMMMMTIMMMMMMVLHQFGHIVINIDLSNSGHCLDIAKVPSVTSLIENYDADSDENDIWWLN